MQRWYVRNAIQKKSAKRHRRTSINCWANGNGEEAKMGGEVADKVLLAACAAEEKGFVMGMRYAFRLFAECMQE